MKKAYILSAVAAGSLAVVATLIISLSSNTGMTGSGAPKSVSPHIDQSRVPHLPPSGQGQPTPSIQQGTPGKAGSPQQVPAPQRQSVAYEIKQPDTLPPEQQPDPTQDPLMPPKQKPKSDQPPIQRLVAQGAEQEQQNPYMPPIQQPMPSYGTQQQQIEQRQFEQQPQIDPQIIEQTPPESSAPPPAETIPNASSSFQPPTPVVPPTPQA